MRSFRRHSSLRFDTSVVSWTRNPRLNVRQASSVASHRNILNQPRDPLNVYANRKQRLVNNSTRLVGDCVKGPAIESRMALQVQGTLRRLAFRRTSSNTHYTNGESMMRTNLAVISNARAGRATARPIVASASAEGFHLPSKLSS